MLGLAFFVVISVWPALVPAATVQEGVYIEQELLYRINPDQPAMHGRQRIWLTPLFVRNEVSIGPNTSVAIFNLQSKDIVLIPTDEKQYLSMTLKDYQRIVSMRLSNAKLNAADNRPELIQTQEHKKIRQWDCMKYVFQQRGSAPVRIEMWIGKDVDIRFEDFLQIMDQLGMNKMLGRLSGFVSKLPGYPIEMTVEQTIEGQKQSSSIKVVKIEKGPVDPALFKIPEGYTRIREDVLDPDLKPQGGR